MKTKEINNSIKKFRMKRGYSINDLVLQTSGEFSQSRISNYETGSRALTINAAKKLAPFLGATPSQLLNLSDTYFQDVKLGEHQEELIRLLEAVSLRGDKDMVRIIAIINAYLNS